MGGAAFGIMSSNNKRSTLSLYVVCVGLVSLCCYFIWSYGWLKVQVAFASEQTHIFEEMRIKAAANDAEEAASCLSYVISYYPSGTKQETGSRLDRIVERERAFAVKDIIEQLRIKTGKDLGDKPEAWIKEFAEQ